MGAALALCAVLAACTKKAHDGLTVGFAQVGSESGWRAAETRMAKSAAQQRQVVLKISDAQQKQENQIKAIRSFIAQGVDGIFLAPVVSSGWDQVLAEARDAKIPVILLDRTIETADSSLYLSAVTSDTVLEGKVAGDWLVRQIAGKPCNVVELQGTLGSSPAINRKKGFADAIAAAANVKIVRTQSADFTRAKAKEVMESFIKAESANGICAVYAHNDDMMIGAIQAMKEAGLKPGKDVLTISIDAVPDIFKAMADGEANATVELTPDMAGPALDLLIAYRNSGTTPARWVQTESKLYLPDTAAQEYEKRKDLY
jgi:simple sugar transport system substrate-binding protein